MTFYWWSHWFWITLISYMILYVGIVHTYPSQELTLEYNQNTKPSISSGITKLYQTSSSSSLLLPVTSTAATVATVTNKTLLLTEAPSINASAHPATVEKRVEEQPNEELLELEKHDENSSLELESRAQFPLNFKEEINNTDDLSISLNEDVDELQDDFEFKRSAELINKTSSSSSSSSNELNQATVANGTSNATAEDIANESSKQAKLKRDQVDVNNYTNSSSNYTNPASTNRSIEDVAIQNVSAAINTNRTNARENITTTLAWLNSVAAVTVSDPNEGAIREEENAAAAAAVVDQKIPFTLENVNKEDDIRRAETEQQRSRKSKVLSAEYKHLNRFINYSTDSKSLLTRSTASAVAPNEYESDDGGNISSEALAIQHTYFLDAGAISAICFTVFGFCCTVATIGIVLYRRRYINKPQALSEPDSSVYIDDSTMRVSDNSDEMYSLDNDSFLNSLEAMTIQNYWTDTVKHTKL